MVHTIRNVWNGNIPVYAASCVKMGTDNALAYSIPRCPDQHRIRISNGKAETRGWGSYFPWLYCLRSYSRRVAFTEIPVVSCLPVDHFFSQTADLQLTPAHLHKTTPLQVRPLSEWLVWNTRISPHKFLEQRGKIDLCIYTDLTGLSSPQYPYLPTFPTPPTPLDFILYRASLCAFCFVFYSLRFFDSFFWFLVFFQSGESGILPVWPVRKSVWTRDVYISHHWYHLRTFVFGSVILTLNVW